MKKVSRAEDAVELEQIPNVGKAVARDLRGMGIKRPQQLKKQDGIALYRKLNKQSGIRHDPCMADTFLAVVAFMNGGPAKPWWAFTEERKKLLPPF